MTTQEIATELRRLRASAGVCTSQKTWAVLTFLIERLDEILAGAAREKEAAE